MVHSMLRAAVEVHATKKKKCLPGGGATENMPGEIRGLWARWGAQPAGVTGGVHTEERAPFGG
ncbi:hypothetical protein ACRAWF_38505 [Streptomyces sp. L7]